VRLYGLQKKDALQKALNLCAKLKAKKSDATGDDVVYELPYSLGTIVMHEVYNNGIFLKLTFHTCCNKLPFYELWYVTLKKYNQR